MKYYSLLILVLIFSCTGTLTDEQRKKMKENMEMNEIKKATDAEITEAAFQFGRQTALIIQKRDKTLSNQSFLDSLSQALEVEIFALQSGNQNLRSVERQLLEAYTSEVQSSDNIQKMGPDSLLYTKPLVREHPDGSTEFTKAIGIRMTKKQIVLKIK
jgi:hypothetical protein